MLDRARQLVFVTELFVGVALSACGVVDDTQHAVVSNDDAGAPSGGSAAAGAGSTVPAHDGAGAGGMQASGSGTGGSDGNASMGGAGSAILDEGITTAPGACGESIDGIYAIKLELDAWWNGGGASDLFDPGRGAITIHAMAEASVLFGSGLETVASVYVCGVQLPPLFVDAACAAVQLEVPDASWDAPTVPAMVTTLGASGLEPGDTLSLASRRLTVGIELASGESAWPSASEVQSLACDVGIGLECFKDHDDDGAPGITAAARTSGALASTPYACASGQPWSLAAVPLATGVGALTSPAASTLDVGLGITLAGMATFGADCQIGEGTAHADRVGLALRSAACALDGGAACSALQASFLDAHLPALNVLVAGAQPPTTWTHPREAALIGTPAMLDRSLSAGPRISIQRLGSAGGSFTCSDVRNAAFPD